jgi:hypothetical protein
MKLHLYRVLQRLTFLVVIFIGMLLSYFAFSSVKQVEALATNDRDALLRVFSDFEFVGSDKFSPSSAYESLPAHRVQVKTLPSNLKVNHLYFFHYRGQSDNQELFKLMQKRLQENGMNITNKVEAYLFAGWLSFQVDFEVGNYKGVILNIPHRKAAVNDESLQPPDIDDYVLAVGQITEPK